LFIFVKELSFYVKGIQDVANNADLPVKKLFYNNLYFW